MKEYRESIHQEPEIDCNDEKHFGSLPVHDLDGCITYTSKMKSNRQSRTRGAEGVLNGLYNNSYAEPTWQRKDQRKSMLKQLKSSDNPDDIMMLFSLTVQPNLKKKPNFQKLVNRRKRVREGLIAKATGWSMFQTKQYIQQCLK